MNTPLFIVLITCVTSILGNSRNSKCSKTICPAVEATICVKVEPKYTTQTHTRYVMMSKCKLKQNKCFNDVKTTVVPVKLCSATSLRDSAEPDGDREKVQKIVDEMEKKANEMKDQSEKIMNEYKDQSNKFGPLKSENQEDKAALSEGEALGDDKEESERPNSDSDYKTTGEPLEETTQTPNDPEPKGDEAPEDDAKKESEATPNSESDYNTTGEPVEEPTQTPNNPQSKEVENQTETSLVSETPAIDTEAAAKMDGDTTIVPEDTTEPFDESTPTANYPVSKGTDQIYKNLEYSDAKASEPQSDDKNDSKNQKLDNRESADNEGECPQKCPTGDVMVCARCSHRIYRTFMSLCYMRMYQCHNPDEKLELVSRHACQGSAPYLGEMVRPKNNLMLSQDDDPVLNYIFAAKDSGHPKLNVR